MQLIFVFGTLKRGFPLHPKLHNAAYMGPGRTVEAFPMYVAGGIRGPMMIDRPGRGLRVVGELFGVSPEQLDGVDEAEEIGKPGNFRRLIPVVTAARQRLDALAFFKDERLARPRASGYLTHYHDGRFLPPKTRPSSLPPLHLLSKTAERA
ncbi:MAG: gamma-glutamylcyclotransferase [Mesorhizobium amorphae]|nr:MAG: gamma-glutamylcyclotransferase [Mesorhizobium amorphae]